MKKIICMAIAGAMLLMGCGSSSAAEGSSSSGASSGASSDTQSSSSASQEGTAPTEEEIQAQQELVDKCFTEGTYFPQLEAPEHGEEIAVLTTNKGVIKIKFCPDEAPNAVENFKTHVNDGYYDGLIFHRVIDGFMIQGGDPNGNGTGGESIWGGKFDDELSGDLYHFRGALAMANSGPNTNGSQFYIVQAPQIEDGYFDYVDSIIEQYGQGQLLYNSQTGQLVRTNYSEEARAKYNELGGTPHLDFGYTIFGQVFEGMDIVDAIAAVETDDNDKPTEDIIIEKAEIVPYEG